MVKEIASCLVLGWFKRRNVVRKGVKLHDALGVVEEGWEMIPASYSFIISAEL
jgi:hypothetical protein